MILFSLPSKVEYLLCYVYAGLHSRCVTCGWEARGFQVAPYTLPSHSGGQSAGRLACSVDSLDHAAAIWATACDVAAHSSLRSYNAQQRTGF